MNLCKAICRKRITAFFLLICIFFASISAGEATEWTCPACGQTGNSRNFCPNCGQARPEAEPENLKPIQIPGSVITFGTYPQTETGKDMTPIEWIVVDVQREKSLLLSKYALDTKPYNTEWTNTTWETCTLRFWLNNMFIQKAFNSDEQEMISETEIDNGKSTLNQEWNTDGGNNTTDKVFLLSCGDMEKYFPATIERLCMPSAYCIAKHAWLSEEYGSTWWWLRSPGAKQNYAAGIREDIVLSDNTVNFEYGCVRPALWINSESYRQ